MIKMTSQLKTSLNEAFRIDERKIADKIISIGFKCRRCARCCREEYGDNTVYIFPFEIRHIIKRTGIRREEIAIPAPSEHRDVKGNIHTFEWILKKNGDCTFHENETCRIYECRPYICRTYPFYLLEGNLMTSECEGLGNTINYEDAMKIAVLLKERYITEIKESISLIEKFRGFAPSGQGYICVHDSEGEHWL